MTLETDLLLDRRRLKRHVTFWRVAAVAAVVFAAWLAFSPGLGPAHRAHIARLSITGLISDDRKLIDMVDRAARDPMVPAMIVYIDSPGGSVGGGESLHDAIARVAAKKPVVAVMGGIAASAGYMAALPATRIFARESTITGSIGVLMETPELSGLLGKVGVDVNTLVSGPLKDQPSLVHPTSAQGKQVLQGLVNDLYGMFVDMVAESRHMDPARVRELADGRAYTGRQAKALGLIDALGDEADARAWLAQSRRVAADLPVHDVKPRQGWRERVFGAQTFVGVLADAMQLAWGTASGRFDMPMAVWRPASMPQG